MTETRLHREKWKERQAKEKKINLFIIYQIFMIILIKWIFIHFGRCYRVNLYSGIVINISLFPINIQTAKKYVLLASGKFSPLFYLEVNHGIS